MAPAPTIKESAAGLYRTHDGLGPWPYRGKVAAVGIGHSPTARRWDGTPDTAIGAQTIAAIRTAIKDAGVDAGEIDLLVMDCKTTAGGSPWPVGEAVPKEVVEQFVSSSDPLDGVAQLSPQWLLLNLPELSGVKLVILATECISMVLAASAEAVGRGLGTTCVAVKAWHNLAGRYGVRGATAESVQTGNAKYGVHGYGVAGTNCFGIATQFRRYLHKYGKTREMMAPFVVNSRDNGLLFPEGYWAQHSPTPITIDDYVHARPIAEPANLLDNDLPIHAAAAYVITTSERAIDLRHRPAYVLGHAGTGVVDGESYTGVAPRSTMQTLEEAEDLAAATARRVYESAQVTAADLAFENCYDGFSFLHPFHIEGFGYAGIRPGEALDLYQTDISISGPHPVSPSGGNIGGGRTRWWSHTDSIQQIQLRAGKRQITQPATVGLSGGFTQDWNNFIVWSQTPDGP
ncbi:putative thiolase [Gordonia polyisoprenivorans VH2]|uniref:Putative thiolase n=1 Tax=Gordonia polyisoprenivorans (strain DSM 44266 / VH2) TaxID=1112204 RepID=H6N4J1_GORPV|nr:thiolase [Gordonia polyisoprenivorans]AFA73573.1 putative thiolase [Gordonia polyisoprenivorans VH2]